MSGFSVYRVMKGRRILVGVTGGIAAYKIPLLIRLLVLAGAEVRVICTSSAFDFVTRPTLAVLSGHVVLSEMTEASTGVWNNHVELGNWADVFVIAPLTANTLSKMANGLCDNLLMATYLSAKCLVMVAPAMDLDMWQHPAVLRNMEMIRSYGHQVIGPESGALASGLTGMGRMSEPEAILAAMEKHFHG